MTRFSWLLVLIPILLSSPASGETVRQLTDVRVDSFSSHTIDDSGGALFFVSSVDLGTNPAHSHQLVESDLAGGLTQATSLAKGTGFWVSVSDDGSTVAFASTADPLGTNHDASLELFLMSSGGSSIVQLTDHPGPDAPSVGRGQLSGSGNKVIFLADTDPLGSNPGHFEQLFIIDADGSNLAQLTSTTGDGAFNGHSISDDGRRITFSHSGDLTGGNPDLGGEVFMVSPTGTGLRQLTSSATLESWEPVLSGDGTQIAYWEATGRTINRIDIGGGNQATLTSGGSPSITDDGNWVYFQESQSGYSEIWVIAIGGGTPTQLTFSDPPVKNHSPIVSGGNTHVVFETNGEYPGGDNPDGGSELMVMQPDGSNPQQLTVNVNYGQASEPDVTPDGRRAVFSARTTAVPWQSDIFRIQTDGTDLFQFTANASATAPTITDDGGRIAFLSTDDLTGENSCGWNQVFTVLADGTGITQLTAPDNCDQYNSHPVIAPDGSVVVFQSDGEYAGNSNGGVELFVVPATGGAVGQITDYNEFVHMFPRISGDSQWVAYSSTTDHDGLNPDESNEVFRARIDGSLVERITADPGEHSWAPDISADGNLIAYRSYADPLGTNAENNAEIFLYDVGNGTTQQLTFTADAVAVSPRISGDGAYVYFISNHSYFGDPRRHWNLYRLTVTGGVVERASGLRDVRGGVWPSAPEENQNYATDAGGRVVFTGGLDASGGNLDLNLEVWISDFEVSGTLEPSRSAPTLVHWTAEPGPVRYDVIRGDAADLQPGAGGTVDLGTVVCIEDDSPDNDTAGFEDVEQPASGQLFIYLYRGTQGTGDGPGSWGRGSGDAERVPSGGSCLPAS